MSCTLHSQYTDTATETAELNILTPQLENMTGKDLDHDSEQYRDKVIPEICEHKDKNVFIV